jgi:D-serine deaminase-like pyridoxal phosphate-dependent protein
MLIIPVLFSFIDCAATLRQLQEYAVAHNWHVPVLIKIDAGNKRAGVPDSDALDIAREAYGFGTGEGAGVQLMGVYSHSGHAYACQCLAEAQACAVEEFRRMGELCARLEAAGIQVPFVSVGSVRQHVSARAEAAAPSCWRASFVNSHALFAADASLLHRGRHEGRGAGVGYPPRSARALVFCREGVSSSA